MYEVAVSFLNLDHRLIMIVDVNVESRVVSYPVIKSRAHDEPYNEAAVRVDVPEYLRMPFQPIG